MCDLCTGSGVVATAPPTICPQCRGTGGAPDHIARHRARRARNTRRRNARRPR